MRRVSGPCSRAKGVIRAFAEQQIRGTGTNAEEIQVHIMLLTSRQATTALAPNARSTVAALVFTQ